MLLEDRKLRTTGTWTCRRRNKRSDIGRGQAVEFLWAGGLVMIAMRKASIVSRCMLRMLHTTIG